MRYMYQIFQSHENMSHENQSSTYSSSSIPPNVASTIHPHLNERLNSFDNISAEEDVLQFIGSSNGHCTAARSISAKARATQCFGDMSDHTFQQVSHDRTHVSRKDIKPLSDSTVTEKVGGGQRLGRIP
ncbi:uncharacterized protein BO97DRAFT_30895 [Aspergillus homomorphus CBS 101889]|uniref:Uncharacterized protein n=1 Tax=Aspergillus homomorphus (strain CBS 101889) TaxID=1450537 RepID=A0A395HFK5_ASPHC|nr:hypothetical protein BO97DRAFT_30895 [Aspergillus homomorphus CBS 101889]RAL06510.1 hypothetical protein BO97DRAFT_30895 [Aspergillus homomorphus CBS 101889]